MTFQRFQRYDTLPEYTTDRSAKGVLIWSGTEPVPSIGSDVKARMNQLGTVRVVGYASENEFLGIMCYPLNPPDWWIKQNGPATPDKPGLLYGAELSKEV